MLEFETIHDICVTKLIDEPYSAQPKTTALGQADVPVVAPYRFYCSVDGEGQYVGQVIGEVLHIGDVRRAEYRYDGILHVLRDEPRLPRST